jgi:hypothetical protein
MKTVSTRKVIVACGITSVLGVCTILGLWQLLTPADRTPKVPFSDLVAGVRAGQVRDIRINEHTYVFRLDDGNAHVQKEATGPEADLALVRSLASEASDAGAHLTIGFAR